MMQSSSLRGCTLQQSAERQRSVAACIYCTPIPRTAPRGGRASHTRAIIRRSYCDMPSRQRGGASWRRFCRGRQKRFPPCSSLDRAVWAGSYCRIAAIVLLHCAMLAGVRVPADCSVRRRQAESASLQAKRDDALRRVMHLLTCGWGAWRPPSSATLAGQVPQRTGGRCAKSAAPPRTN